MATPRRTKVNLEDLLGSLDDIPAMMNQMRGDSSISGTSNRSSALSQRANRVLNNLSSLGEGTNSLGNYVSSSDVSEMNSRRESANSGSAVSTNTYTGATVNSSQGTGSINFSQIQDALRGVSTAQLYTGPNSNNISNGAGNNGVGDTKSRASAMLNTYRDPPGSISKANTLTRNPNAAVGIPMGAYDALAKLASVPQRKHYMGQVSAHPSQRYQDDSEDILNNRNISVFDVARNNPQEQQVYNSSTQISDLLASSSLVNTPGSARGKRFEYTKSNTQAPYHGPPRASSAPPRTTVAKALSTTIAEKKGRGNSSDDSSTVSGLSRSSLYNAIYNPRSAATSSSSVASATTSPSADSRMRKTAKGFRAPAVPHGPNHVDADPAEAAHAETEVVAQLKGTAGGLRRMLQKADVSRSGKLNFDDFRMGLKKSGIHISDEHASALFFDRAEPVGDKHGYYGYTGGQALDIEKFVLGIANKSSAPLYSHVTAKEGSSNRAQAVREAEEMRVLRKVVHATNKQADPMLVFRTLEPRQKRYLTPGQFREGLMHIGAPLNDVEFELLMEKVDTNHAGRIDVGEFQTLLSKSVRQVDQAAINQRQQDLHSHGRYTPTYRSNVMDQCMTQSEFGHVRDSQVVRREDFRWSKLKAQLQKEKDAVLRAFSGTLRHGERHGDRGKKHIHADHSVGYAVQPLTMGQLRAKLAQEGVYLNEDDAERLHVHVERALGDEKQALDSYGTNQPSAYSGYDFDAHNSHHHVHDSAPITLDGFCQIVGIPKTTTKDNRTGMFSYSNRRLLCVIYVHISWNCSIVGPKTGSTRRWSVCRFFQVTHGQPNVRNLILHFRRGEWCLRERQPQKVSLCELLRRIVCINNFVL
jgi:Ca2+-binding EF-hand superfamily protein